MEGCRRSELAAETRIGYGAEAGLGCTGEVGHQGQEAQGADSGVAGAECGSTLLLLRRPHRRRQRLLTRLRRNRLQAFAPVREDQEACFALGEVGLDHKDVGPVVLVDREDIEGLDPDVGCTAGLAGADMGYAEVGLAHLGLAADFGRERPGA